MNNVAITIEDLHEGDEIIVSRYSDLVYLKVLVQPSKNKDGHWKTVKCSVHVKEDKMVRGSHIWTNKTYMCSPPSEHNNTRWYDLSYRTLWLVNRENN